MAIGKVIGRIAIKVLPDTSDFREETANDLRRIEKQLGNVEVDIIPEINKGARDKLKAELQKLAKDLKVKIDLELANGDVVRTQAELKALAKQRTVKIAPELDNGAVARVAAGLAAMSGLRSLRTMAARFRAELMDLDKAVPKIGVVSHAIAGLGAWILGASGNLFSLSSSLATMGQAGLALPGIFGGLTVGISTTVAALVDFNKQVPQASRYVKELQDTISKNFWEAAAEPIRNLVDKLFPLLNKALTGTSAALGRFFANFANSTTNLLLPALPGMFDSLTKSIQVASGFTDQFVGIIEKLGTLGASYLPSFAKWVGDIATQFDNWLSSADLSGMIDQGIDSIKKFGSATASLFSIFHSLGQAAAEAGGSTLTSLADGLGRAADAVRKGTPFYNQFRDTLSAAYTMMDQIGNIAGPNLTKFLDTMASRFQSLAPLIGDTIGTAISAISGALSSPAVTEGLTAMFQGFNNMVHSLAPAMEPLAEKFAALGKLIGAVAQNLGVVLAAAIESLAPIFVSVANALLPVINMLGPMLAGVIKALSPVFEEIGTQLSRVITALKPLFTAFQDLANLLMPVLVPILKILVEMLGNAVVEVIHGVTWVIEGLTKVVNGVIDVFKGLWDVLAGLFTLDFSRVWDGLKQAFSGLGGILLGALQATLGAVWAYLNGTVLGFFRKFVGKLAAPFLKGPLGTVLRPFVTGLSKAWDFIEKFVGDAVAAFKLVFEGGIGGSLGRLVEVFGAWFPRLAEAFTKVFGVIKTIVSTAWKVISTLFETSLKIIWTIVKAVFDLIALVFRTAFTVIETIVSTAFGVIKTFVQSAMDGLYYLFVEPWTAIAEFIQMILVQIQAALTLVWSSIQGFLFGQMNKIRVIIEDVWNAISGVIKTVLSTIAKVLKGAWTGIQTSVKTAWGAVQALFNAAWTAIKNVVQGGISNVVNFVKGIPGRLRSALGSLGNTLRSIFSSAWNGAKTIVSDAGEAILSAISAIPDKLRGLGGVFKNAAQYIIKTFVDGLKNAAGIISGIAGSVWDAVKKLINGAIDKINDLLDFKISIPGPDIHVNVPDIPHLATGGRAKRATLAVIGEGSEPESVLPDSVLRGLLTRARVAGIQSIEPQLARIEERMGNLAKNISSGFRDAQQESSNGSAGDSTTVEQLNIGISLEDLAQLKDLEEFLELLRVRIRQG